MVEIVGRRLWPIALVLPGLGALAIAVAGDRCYFPIALVNWCTAYWWQLLLPGSVLYLVVEGGRAVRSMFGRQA